MPSTKLNIIKNNHSMIIIASYTQICLSSKTGKILAAQKIKIHSHI